MTTTRDTRNGGRRCAASYWTLPALVWLCAWSPARGQEIGPSSFVSVPPQAVALTHARVVDGTGAPAREDQTVLLQGARILSIGPSAETPVPDGARVLDLSQHTVLPGLVQLHEHTYFGDIARATQMRTSAPLLLLGYGVTTAMTAGSQLPYHELKMKRAIDAGEQIGPSFLIAGPYIDGATSLPFVRSVSTPGEARRVIAYWGDEGATWVKLLGRASRAVVRASVEEAHARGMRVSGHLCAVTFTEAAELGVDALQHGFLMDTDYVADKAADVCPRRYFGSYEDVDIDGPAVRASIAAIVEHGSAVVSTLSVYETFVEGRAFLDPRALETLAPEVRARVEARHADPEKWDLRLSPRLFRKMMAWERAFVDAGGLLGSGSDPWESGLVPGVGNARNYELFVEAGFAPEAAVRNMTYNGARILGMERTIGSIEPGKRADLMVVRGDPLRTPSDIYHVVTVFKGGIGYDGARLRAAARGKVGVE